MNNFDRLIVSGCEPAIEALNALRQCHNRDPRCDDPSFAQQNPAICGIDPRCSDPLFAEANQLVCGPSTSELILKPSSILLCRDKSVQLRTFIRSGTTETEVTTGIVFTSTNQSVATVGALGGNVTGSSEGVATISAEWLGKTAFSQVSVMGTEDCCGDITNNIVILVDNSKSMGVAFGGAYSSKLSFAKDAANKFVNGVDLDKDRVALYSFNEAATEVVDFSDDSAALLTAIGGLAVAQSKTNVFEGLEEAIQDLDAVAVPGSRRIVVIISDFENKLGPDPRTLVQPFFDSGGVIIVVAVRANGTGYVLGNRLASGGFFLNAYPSVEALVLSSLDGLKAYFCSGNCIPEGDIYASRAKLNFTAFTQWNVTAGLTDLIGKGSDGVAQFDLIPGNGLYLDMSGSGPVFDATIETKNTLALEPGNNYRLTLRVAGNQRNATATGKMFINLGTTLVEQQLDRAWSQNFTDEVIEFSVAASETPVLNLRYKGDRANNPFGFLLDLVKLENVTTGEVLLNETWDSENLLYIPPGCGQGTIELPGGGYGYGYDCNPSDCLNIPPDTQRADPIIAPEVEDAAPPRIYTATKTVTVTCPAGQSGPSVTRTATATSLVSQTDANTQATALATQQATDALACGRAPAVGDIISLAFHSAEVLKTGFAAIGSTSSDFWNSAALNKDNLKYVDGTLSGVELVYTAGWGNGFFPTHPDRLMQEYAYRPDSPFSPIIGPLPVGEYEIYVYAHGELNSDNARFIAQVGTYSGGVFTVGSTYENKATENGANWKTMPWVEGSQYVKFKVINGTAGKYIRLLQLASDSLYYLINGIQIFKKSAGPDAGLITMTGSHKAVPCPSVKFVEDTVGVITSIKVNLNGLWHNFPIFLDILLVGPDGTHVMLMSDAGGPAPGIPSSSPVNIVLDDGGGHPYLPQGSAFLSQSYHTKDYVVIAGESSAYGSGAPPGPHSADLLVFVGKPANGAWLLYVIDSGAGNDVGAIANWSLTITTA